MKTALVTGGSKGIGLALVLRLLSSGYHIVTCSRRTSTWLEALENYQDLKAVDYQVVDISDEKQLAGFFEYVGATYGSLSIGVNNASPALESSGEYHTVDVNRLRNTLQVDFWAQALCLKYELGLMSNDGRIVNVGSINGLRPTPNASMYSASKHALEGLTRSLALENIGRGIRINAVAPGVTWTPRWEKKLLESKGSKQEISNLVPMKRFASTEEIVDAIEFLLSERASYIVGHTLVVDGGLSLS